MSLSNDLKTLGVWFQECLDGRAEFSLEGAREFRKELDRAAWNAAALEERVGDTPPSDEPSTAENVIRFRRQPKPRPVPSRGGDAA